MAKLSMCMIVKDEARNLGRILEDLRPHVDEIVVVDTGSTDGSQEIAKKWADVFDEIEWPGSFSVARNIALDKASGDWILIVDGDEYPAEPDKWRVLRTAIEQTPGLDGLLIEIHNQLPPGQMLQSDSFWQLRVFRNLPGIRYEGRVHNQLMDALAENLQGENPKVLKVDCRLEHFGYDPKQVDVQAKYQARLAGLVEEMNREDMPQRWRTYYQFQLGNAYFMLRDFDEAQYIFNEIDLDELTEENKFSVCMLSVHTCMMIGQLEAANDYATKLLDTWPHEPLAFSLKGLALMAMEKWEAALNFLLAAMQRETDPTRPAKYHLDAPYTAAAAGECALKCGRLGEAKHLFQLHLQKYPDNVYIADLESRIVKDGQTEAPPSAGSLHLFGADLDGAPVPRLFVPAADLDHT